LSRLDVFVAERLPVQQLGDPFSPVSLVDPLSPSLGNETEQGVGLLWDNATEIYRSV
jgi:hypothetical protein